MSEEFWSRVYCVPNLTVEAVSGETNTSLPAEDISHHHSRPSADQDPTRKRDCTLALVDKMGHYENSPTKPPPTSAIHPDNTHKNHEETSAVPGQERTEVNLAIEYQFSNTMYAALSQAAAPKVADKMIEAFEKRVKAVVEGPSSV